MKYETDDVARILRNHPYYGGDNKWFFPNDVMPHSPAFKYACKKLSEKGILEKRRGGRWGYSYRFIRKPSPLV